MRRGGGGFAVSQSSDKAVAFDFAPAASRHPESSARLRSLLFFHLSAILEKIPSFPCHFSRQVSIEDVITSSRSRR